MNALTDIQSAYLAGLIDGEGCFFISKYQGKNNRTPVYTAQIIITMTDKSVIEYVRSATGAGNIFYQSRENIENNCAVYRWTVNSAADVVSIIRAIMPYLHVKQNEAQVMIDFLSLPSTNPGRGKSMPMFYVSRRDEYYQRLRDMKTRGKAIREDRPMPEMEPIYDPQMPLF